MKHLTRTKVGIILIILAILLLEVMQGKDVAGSLVGVLTAVVGG